MTSHGLVKVEATYTFAALSGTHTVDPSGFLTSHFCVRRRKWDKLVSSAHGENSHLTLIFRKSSVQCHTGGGSGCVPEAALQQPQARLSLGPSGQEEPGPALRSGAENYHAEQAVLPGAAHSPQSKHMSKLGLIFLLSLFQRFAKRQTKLHIYRSTKFISPCQNISS